MNRYNNILPCKSTIRRERIYIGLAGNQFKHKLCFYFDALRLWLDKRTEVKLLDSDEEEEGYINASYINVKYISSKFKHIWLFFVTSLCSSQSLFGFILYYLNCVYKISLYLKAIHIGVGEKKFIATQGPLPETLGHFWKMVWNEGVQCIVMVCNLKVI